MIDHIVSDATKLGAFGPAGAMDTCRNAVRRFSCASTMGAHAATQQNGHTKFVRRSSATHNSARTRRDGRLLASLGPARATHFADVVQRKHIRKLSTLASAVPISAETPRHVAHSLPDTVREYVARKATLVGCKEVHICDGSEEERKRLVDMMAASGMLSPLRKHENCWLARTDPRDVARVESKTFICTRDKHDVVPRGAQQEGALGNWMHVDELDERLEKLLRGCMRGRTMYVIPFSMGPIGSTMSKVGIQLTDSPYVVVSMHIMTRVSHRVLELIRASARMDDFVRCTHSVGCPLPLARALVNEWPCDPDNTIISHIPERKEIVSYGSGYGGNSLLGKKCFALRLGSILGRDEGWLAEHMLILGVTNPRGQKKYVAAAFPSACGKTNLAMMTPTLPGYKIECVGDDIAWMRFDENGELRAINPEAGFFGVAPGTNERSNPNAMATIQRNTIFTNVAETHDGDFYWEGLEHTIDSSKPLKDWLGNAWTRASSNNNKKAAHPNSRFCAPAAQCPIIDPLWESAEGVPISAIIFGGRRPEGVPLVYESFDWAHGVYVGASMRSESTAAAEHAAKVIMHDPFAMRPFFGYNFGRYLAHWLSFASQPSLKLPKVFHVNWFRKHAQTGAFLWPGFGENSRVLDWICRRVDGEQCAQRTPIGFVPAAQSINLRGLDEPVNMDELLSVEREFWLAEQATIERYLRANVGHDLPAEIMRQSDMLKSRLLATSGDDDDDACKANNSNNSKPKKTEVLRQL